MGWLAALPPMTADVELDEEAGAAGELVARAGMADDRGAAGIAHQPVIAEIGAHPPVAAEPVGEPRHRAERVEAAARLEGGQAAPRRRAGRDSEIGAGEVGIAPA